MLKSFGRAALFSALLPLGIAHAQVPSAEPITLNADSVLANVQATNLASYLPQDVTYDPTIPTPAEVVGHDVGEWHVRHDSLVRYMEVLAKHSDRFEIEYTGRTHEQRPLVLLRITAPENQANIEELREAHLTVADPSIDANVDETPLVYYMGYSIHGDESSGSNAALLVAYYLAAAQGEAVDALLEDSIILLDPSLNPDGLGRFAQWANQHKSQNLVADDQHQEHVQGTPTGRVNHYWFDLNRDWLLLQHPESRARIANFHKWKPNVLTDFHEMGTDSTFFFQPGIPTRRNPYTPEENVELTAKLAEHHAAELDKQGRLYFTEEAFDDFYVGKGSTYPDVHGAIGILFEQASSRGHLQDSINGPLSFPYTIQNQFTTSLTTLFGAHENKRWFLDYQQRFFDSALEAADDADFTGIVLSEKDSGRMNELLNVLAQHQISAYPLTRDVEIDDVEYQADESFYVPLAQSQYRLIRAMFSTKTNFVDNTFYDVSAWTLPYAFNVQHSRYDGRISHADEPWQMPSKTSVQTADNAYAYAFDWDHYFAPKMLNELLEAGVHARQAYKPFTAKTSAEDHSFKPGAVIIPRAYQQLEWSQIQSLVSDYATELQIPVHNISSGLTPNSMDFGSRNIRPVELPKVALLMGRDASFYEAGEAWYYLDRHVGIPLTMLETDRVASSDLSRYTHIVLVDGSYRNLDDSEVERIQQWVKKGGTIIGQQGGARWLVDNDLLAAEWVEQSDFDDAFEAKKVSFGDMDDFYGQRRLAGAIFEQQLDLTHPLAFGFPREALPVFKDSLNAMYVPDTSFITAATYSSEPLMAGFTAKPNQKVLANKAAMVAHRYGSGRVIGWADDVNFRAFFWGSAKLLSNAIFLSPGITPSASNEENAAAADEEAQAH